jgi:hypothetical protein
MSPRRFGWTVLAAALLVAAQSTLAKAIDDTGDIQLWPVTLVDGETDQILAGVKVSVQAALHGQQQQQSTTLTSSGAGVVDIPLRPGDATFVYVVSPGWCTEGWPLVGEADWDNDGQFDTPPRDKPRTISLWKGTAVAGRLLTPEGTPAAGVTLQAGVYVHNPPWPQPEQRVWHSWDHGQWPNWHRGTTTEDDGSFQVTVPPRSARSWIRIGTGNLDYTAIDTEVLSEKNPSHSLVKFAPFEVEVNEWEDEQIADPATGAIDLGDLHLQKGVVLTGRVVDAEGNPLSGVHLLTSNRHGPYAGRKAISRADGCFEFQPFNPGKFTLTADARLRDRDGQVISRDVQAVFVESEITLAKTDDVVKLKIQAVPHVELGFEWVDRRAEKGPVSYYGHFDVIGRVVDSDGSRQWWRGETQKIERNGTEFLIVKTPADIVDAELHLVADSRVTAAYADDHTTSGPGRVLLGDISQPMRRVIYGYEPQEDN